jgi:Nickel-dependent hydrogenase/NADH ubiquinone oxidoreductase, 20 Kd subunit
MPTDLLGPTVTLRPGHPTLEPSPVSEAWSAPAEVVPRLLERSLPVHRVVDVDVFLPGCPPSADLIYATLIELLEGRAPDAAQRPLRRLTGGDRGAGDHHRPRDPHRGPRQDHLQLDDRGEVADAHFHVTQFRGFERICQGRPIHELPSLMARICGICPVSHLVASAKACDEILAVSPPPTGADLRRVMNLAQVVQSHALSFFHLASPDLLFGFGADPDGRHLLGALAANPQLARDGVGVRRFGQQIIESLGDKRIHPGWVVPGGVAAPLTAETRDQMLAALPEVRAATERALAWYKSTVARFAEEASAFGNFPAAFMGLVGRDGTAEHYTGRCGWPTPTASCSRSGPRPYWEYLGEAVEPWSYLKSAYWQELGYPAGVYRVGPLARLSVADRMGTPRADGAGLLSRAARPVPGQLVPLPPRPTDRDPVWHRAARSTAQRPGDPLAAGAVAGRHQPE